MKIWKIEHSNKTTDGAKIAVSISSSESKGLILNQGEFVLCQEQITAALDSQKRRGFIIIENFDNSSLRLELGVTYPTSLLKNLAAQKAASVEKATAAIISESSVKEEDEENAPDMINKLERAKKDATDYINDNDNI